MKLISLAALALPLLAAVAHELTSYTWRHQCPQLEPLFPEPLDRNERKGASGLDEYLKSERFFHTSVDRLSGAVQIDTVSQGWWQDLPGDDPVWKDMKTFRKYLKKTFPLIHHRLHLEKVNKHGLVYTWKGMNPSLKPTLLLAHQDVVPVPEDTRSEWNHPPFSGFFDGKYVWGRGAFDCKTTLIGAMSAVEALLGFGWQPQRTLILAFGFDEEISGFQGAKRIAEHLEERYGQNGIALLVDEGPGIFHLGESGTTYALPALSEKGTFSANISVRVKSGHSSFSTGPNSIIVMSGLISKIHASQLHAEVQADDPFLQAVFCTGQHVPGLEQFVIDTIHDIDQNETLINQFVPFITSQIPYLKTLVESTQSAAMIQGGIKLNMVPERTTLSINYRLQLGTSVEEAKSHLEQLVKDHIAELNAVEGGTNLTFRGWSEPETVNSIKLTMLPGEREASPVTPFSVIGLTPYNILQRTIRTVYDDKNLTLVAPASLPANTDTRHYWNLTQHIFRFSPGHDMADPTDHFIGSNIHNTNERANIVGHVNGVRWFSLFIQNMDHADLV